MSSVTTRDYSTILALQNQYNSSPSWQYDTSNLSVQSIYGGVTDNRISISRLRHLFLNDPISFGIYQKITDLLTLVDFEIYEIRKGKETLTRASKEYKKLLVNKGIRKIISESIAPAFWGAGFGDALAYKVRQNGKVIVKVDPFVKNGLERVRIYGDENGENGEIQKYSILDERGVEVYKYEAKDVYHIRYSCPDSSPYFSASPSLVASKWLQLKYSIMGANEGIFSTGMQAKHLVGIDANKVKQQGASPQAINNMMEKLKEELRVGNGIQGAGRMLFTPVPLMFQNIQENNSSMRSKEILEYIDKIELFAVYGVDEGVIFPSKSKYDNADKARDSLYQSIQSGIRKIEFLVEEYILPAYDPLFDNSRFIFRIPRQFSQEEIKIKEFKNKETGQYVQNLKTLNETLSPHKMVALPTSEKLKLLEENGIVIKSIEHEAVEIEPAKETQIADSFTQVNHGENVHRSLEEEIDEVYSKYHSLVNMSASELKSWKENECSSLAGEDKDPIDRNIKLLETPKSEWGQAEVTSANRTISFIPRMKANLGGEQVKKTDSGKVCGTKAFISLKNWGYDDNKKSRFFVKTKEKLDRSFKQYFTHA